MENKFFALVGTFLLSLYVLTLCGCASSDVSRDVTSNIDVGVQHTKSMVDASSNSTIADSYQNSSQLAKGAIAGGTAGAIAGYVTSVGLVPGALIGGILGASYGSYIDSNASLEDKLQNRGATIVVLGDQILVMIPSSRIFNDRSARIKQDAYSTLNLAVRYINSFRKMLVKVAVYTDPSGSSSANLALSQEQAEKVSRYMLADGVDARMLYGVGYGGTHLIQRSCSAWDGNDNYRVEFTLEKLYV